jgi:hypothetical protein
MKSFRGVIRAREGLMDLQNYNPAVAANIIAAISLAVSAFTLYRMWRTDRAEAVADHPDVLANVAFVKEQKGWLHVHMKVTNNFDTDLELTEVSIDNARALTVEQTRDRTKPAYDPVQLAVFPVEDARKVVPFRRTLTRAGTPTPQFPAHCGATIWTDFFVFLGAKSPNHLRFSVLFTLRRTDARRRKLIVVKQTMKLPAPP